MGTLLCLLVGRENHLAKSENLRTASIRHHNGTYHDAAYIAGINSYINLLRRLASGSSKIPLHDLSTYTGKLSRAKERARLLIR